MHTYLTIRKCLSHLKPSDSEVLFRQIYVVVLSMEDHQTIFEYFENFTNEIYCCNITLQKKLQKVNNKV